ncbi:hypothetical protein I79_009448 [Cricetulus griseus]|uniref:Uncharacterized protein n=1 Tax=Cricetulus griseus TaxID=10029 RepID=G3HFT3_CRIGR|nr:hypothetical protein I79_009448 [Cricetulus griseus]
MGPHLAWGSGGCLGALLVRAVPTELLGLASERSSSIPKKVLTSMPEGPLGAFPPPPQAVVSSWKLP